VKTLILKAIALLFLCSAGSACAESPDSSSKAYSKANLYASISRTKPLHKKISKPAPGDWLAQHNEKGQTFQQYLNANPVTPDKKRNIIYILPVGDFTEEQEKIIKLTADFMSRYFNLATVIQDKLALSAIPDSAKRTHPTWGDKQVLTTYVLNNVLKPRLPDNAAVYLAFTSSDLWPGQGWNFVFGQASTRARVGVWSIYRNGDPSKDDDSFKLCLMRTMKTAVHETGHMFTMMHCTLYECCMCGSNHREESDRRPVWLCPQCMPKVCWATKVDPVKRYEKLAEFCRKNGFKEEKEFYEKSIKTLQSK
jgi:archaemetzincin